MSLTIPLTPSEEAKLLTKAQSEGTTPARLVRQAIAPILASVPEESFPGEVDEGKVFAARSMNELAALQKVIPLHDVSVLSGGIPTDVDVDEFLEDIYSSRR